MILGNDWREGLHFRITHKGMNWEVQTAGAGYLLYTWHDDDEDEDMPVPKFYYSLRNGDVDDQDVEGFVPGFREAVWSDDAVYYLMD